MIEQPQEVQSHRVEPVSRARASQTGSIGYGAHIGSRSRYDGESAITGLDRLTVEIKPRAPLCSLAELFGELAT